MDRRGLIILAIVAASIGILVFILNKNNAQVKSIIAQRDVLVRDKLPTNAFLIPSLSDLGL